MRKTEVWYKALGRCATLEYEYVSYLLFEAGVATLEELESSDENQTEFCFYSGDLEECKRVVEKFPAYHFQISEEPAKDWDKWWRERSVPVEVSKRLWVRPPWVSFEAKNKEAIVLELEAKTAFGTGEHETTSSTARLMESVDFKGKSVLDIGTGTGILTMFALHLGAALAIGTEIDPFTIPCIAENFSRNHFDSNHAVLGFLDVFKEGTKFDVILCNMIRSELWPLRDDIENLIADGGELVISGQLETEKSYILKWFDEARFQAEEELVKGEWWSVRAKKQGAL